MLFEILKLSFGCQIVLVNMQLAENSNDNIEHVALRKAIE